MGKVQYLRHTNAERGNNNRDGSDVRRATAQTSTTRLDSGEKCAGKTAWSHNFYKRLGPERSTLTTAFLRWSMWIICVFLQCIFAVIANQYDATHMHHARHPLPSSICIGSRVSAHCNQRYYAATDTGIGQHAVLVRNMVPRFHHRSLRGGLHKLGVDLRVCGSSLLQYKKGGFLSEWHFGAGHAWGIYPVQYLGGTGARYDAL